MEDFISITGWGIFITFHHPSKIRTYTPPKLNMIVWKMYLLSNLAILGIYVELLGGIIHMHVYYIYCTIKRPTDLLYIGGTEQIHFAGVNPYPVGIYDSSTLIVKDKPMNQLEKRCNFAVLKQLETYESTMSLCSFVVLGATYLICFDP